MEFVLEGVRERALNSVHPDPILLVNFPDIDHQFKVHLLEDTSTLKLTLTHDDGVWCEEIVLPELKLLRHEGEDTDHLLLAVDQSGSSGADLTVYFSCVPKGRLHLPFSLREMHERVRHSKVKLYHGKDLELQVLGKGNVERILHDLDCPVERMQAQEAPPPYGGRGRAVATTTDDDRYTYRRGDIPIFHDDNDKRLIATLQELIIALRRLKDETENHRRETLELKNALLVNKKNQLKSFFFATANFLDFPP